MVTVLKLGIDSSERRQVMRGRVGRFYDAMRLHPTQSDVHRFTLQ
jgi:hypothetical protein